MKYLFSTLFVLSVISCNQDKAQIENLEKEVFAVHDEVMPKMDKLLELKEAVSQDIAKTDSLLTIKPSPDLEKRKAEGLSISEALEDADQNMMDWMHSFKADSLKTLELTAAMDYLKAEKTKITSVRDKMIDGMARAEKFTGSNP